MKNKILHLTLHRQWFDEIARGEKTEEYREIKPYWTKRLVGKTFEKIHFRNGYSKGSREMTVDWLGMKIGKSHEGVDCYAIQLGKVTFHPTSLAA